MGIFSGGETPNPDQWNDIAGGALNSAIVASSNSITIGDEYFHRITGTTPIQTINTTRNGRVFIMQADPAASDSLSFVPGGNINLPAGSVGFYIVPGTCITMIQDTDGNFNILESNISSLAPKAVMYSVSNQTSLSGLVQIELDASTRDNYSAFDSVAHEYVIPYTGYYTIYGQVRLSSLGATVLIQPFIRSNGANIASSRDTNSTTGGGTEITAVDSILQNQGDVITFLVESDDPSYTINGGKNSSYLNLAWTN